MAALWTEEAKFQSWLLVEKAVARTQAELGLIPAAAAGAIQRATFKLDEIEKFEAETNHDVIAFTKSVAKSIGKHGSYVHYGLTSYDVVDTALSLRCLSSIEILTLALTDLRLAAARLALRYKRTPMIGRTHGVHAEPITFGLKCASWYEEISRSMARLEQGRHEMRFGKVSGTVGSYTQLGPEVESRVLRRLGLLPEPVSTQVIPRDRHAHLVAVLALVATALERIATEIRNLQRTEIAEVAEPFAAGQRGSSAMPHKQNPITCERITGLARVMRSYVSVAYEDVCLWHERDLSNSAAERIILADSFLLLHYLVKKLTGVLTGLVVRPERMLENLESSLGSFCSQGLLLSLVKAGMDKDQAYRKVQELSFACRQNGKPLIDLCRKDRTVSRRLSQRQLKQVFSLKRLLRHVDAVYQRIGLARR